jgi:tRNA(His) guanylyltransferase
MIDELGSRMKEQYEFRTRYCLPRRTYVIIRVDGKAFHTYTRACAKPFDQGLMAAMDRAAIHMCQNIEGAKFAYTQSDEISILLTDFASDLTQMWFDGNVQKICSVSASLATAGFNGSNFAIEYGGSIDPALFDSRVFTIPDPTEVYNYFVWRQKDAIRNSIQMLAQAYFSCKQLHKKGSGELLGMLMEQGINWNDCPDGFKRGRFIERKNVTTALEYTHKKTGQLCREENVTRSIWCEAEMPVFHNEPDWLKRRIPVYP